MITANTSEYDATISKSIKKTENLWKDFGKQINKTILDNKWAELGKMGSAVYDEIKRSAEDLSSALESSVEQQVELNAQALLYDQLLLEGYKTQQKLQSAIVPFGSTALSNTKQTVEAMQQYKGIVEDAEIISIRITDGLLAGAKAATSAAQTVAEVSKNTDKIKDPFFDSDDNPIRRSLNRQKYGVIDEFGKAAKPSDSVTKTLDMIHNPQPGRWKQFFLQLANGFKSVSKFIPLGATGRAVAGIGRAGFNIGSSAVRQFGNAIDRLRDSMTTLKALLIGYVTYIFARWFSRVIDANIATLEFSKTIGSTASSVSGLEYAMAQTGRPVEALREGLVELQGLLFELELGLPGTINQFKRLGLAANDFAGKTTVESFVIIADKISKIADPTKQAMLAVQLWGDKAADLLPLIAAGADGIAEAVQKAKNVGLLVDNEKLEKMKTASIAFDNIKRAIEGIVLQVATQLGPVFGSLIQKLDKWLGGMNAEQMVSGIRDFSIKAVTFFIRMYNSIRIVLIDIGLEVERMIFKIRQNFLTLENRLARNKLFGNDKWLADSRAAIKEYNDDLAKAAIEVDKLRKKQQELANDPMNVLDNVRKWFDDLNKELKDGVAKWNKGNHLIALAKMFTSKLNIGGKSKEMANNLLYPLEQFQGKMIELNKMKSSILPEEFGRAAVQNINQLEEALGATNLRMAELARINTSAGVSAINRATLEQENANQSPQARIERLLKQGNMNQQALTNYAKRTAEALENVNVADFK